MINSLRGVDVDFRKLFILLEVLRTYCGANIFFRVISSA